jgi:hypothetical protein
VQHFFTDLVRTVFDNIIEYKNKYNMSNKKLNFKLQTKLDKQIDLISNTEYLNRQYSIEYLLEQLNYLYQEELLIQEKYRLGLD